MSTLPKPGEIAGRGTDPRFYAALAILPNPDPILRKAGKTEEVFDAIQSDAHVMGELQLINADLGRFKHSLVLGENTRRGKRALELCQSFFDRQPAPHTTWPDVFWNIGNARFRGQSVHEIVWERSGDLLMPERLLDRPQRRFRYSPANELQLLTREKPIYGVPAEEAYFLVNRHMPSYDNPYGIAVFSSCFWPHVFKHAGFRWFVKFCERFGIPFPVGKYPAGTTDAQIDSLQEALQSLIEAGFAAMQDDGTIEIHEAKGASGGGKLAQHLLIEASNAEMSKALSSQTLSSEQTGGNGARAASETHRSRSADVNEGQRNGIAFTLDHLCRLITRFNLGEDVKPPTNEFSADQEGTKERAEVYKIFTDLGGRPSRKAMAADLNIEMADPKDAEDQLQAPAATPLPGAGPVTGEPAEFARGDDIAPDQVALDAGIEQLLSSDQTPVLAPILKPLLKLAKDKPDELLGRLAELYPDMDSSALFEQLYRAIFAAELWGKLSAQAEAA
jgi:phage gp29-like protein